MLTENEIVSLKRVILSIQVAQKRGAFELPEAHAIFESVKVLDSLIKKNTPEEETTDEPVNTNEVVNE